MRTPAVQMEVSDEGWRGLCVSWKLLYSGYCEIKARGVDPDIS
jgi:hypothetical protein